MSECIHLGIIVDARSLGEVGPVLVPIVKFSVAHIGAVHSFNGFLLDLGRNELFLEGSLELGPSSVILGVGS